MKIKKPKPVAMPNLEKLRKITQEYIDFIGSKDYHEDNDYDHYIFEEAINTMFGEEAWEWINNKMK